MYGHNEQPIATYSRVLVNKKFYPPYRFIRYVKKTYYTSHLLNGGMTMTPVGQQGVPTPRHICLLGIFIPVRSMYQASQLIHVKVW